MVAGAVAAEAMELEEPVLPVSSQGTPIQPVDVVVVLQHRPPKGSSCAENQCEAAEHWFASVRAGGVVVEEVAPYPAALSQGNFLCELLRSASERYPKETDYPFQSHATLSIRAAATVPFSVVQRLISDVWQVGICRIEFAVTAAHAKAEERRLDVTLPSDANARSQPLADVWISLQWDRAVGVVVRRLEEKSRGSLVDSDIMPEDLAEFDPDEESLIRREKPATKPPVKLVEPPIAKREFPCDAAGDANLRSFVRGWLADPVRQGSKELSGVIEAAYDVPFQAVVDLIDVFRAAGLEQIGFAVPRKPK
ncbi:MAG: hypothetical protein Q7T30_00665 [Planctomycetota bacterium]|nr:hypothetical protein [Planctomycetota bacterium]